MKCPRRFAPLLMLLPLLLVAPAARADNPFGLMLAPGKDQDLALAAARSAALGVAWYRPPTLTVGHWHAGSPCPACRALSKVGLDLALTLRNGDHPPRPASAPADLTAYAASVAAIIEAWHPALLVIEDEEDQPQRYASDPAAYRRELDTACQMAHQRHLLCSNGGLSYASLLPLIWFGLLQNGKAEQACDFSRRAGSALASLHLCDYRQAAAVPEPLRRSLIAPALALLPVYRDSAIDAVNFHWYGSDPVALAESIDGLARLVGKPLLSNEIGLRRGDAEARYVRPLLRAAMAGRLSLAIWNSNESEDNQSLFEADGRLRPSGDEFAHQMSGRK